MPPFCLQNEPGALQYLINLTAGLMDGDAHLVELTVRSGARVVVTGQSATRVHPALASYATQQWNAQVEGDAMLVALPGPVIPYRNCRYYQRGRVDLARDARLIWGDVWLPGRYERGELSERFEFERMVQDFEVRREGRLIFRDRFCWDGPWTSDEVRWHFGDGWAAATLLIAGPAPAIEHSSDPACLRSVFPLESGDTCVRWCGEPTAVTDDLVRWALGSAGFWTGGAGAPPWLLESGGLTPNHWFSPLGTSPV